MSTPDTAWVPLSSRTPGSPTVYSVIEGVPPWLYVSLQRWLYRVLQDTSGPITTLRPGHGYTEDTQQIMLRVRCAEQPWMLDADDPTFLDAIDAAPRWVNWREVPLPDETVRPETPHSLEALLVAANSVWRVSDQFRGLEHRADPTATHAVQMAAATDQTAGEHLAASWEAAYGRRPDPDKAYDEAVMAVEALACPLVCPNTRRSLGTVVADLHNQASRWELTVGDTTTNQPAGVDSVIAMMDLLWKGQSRHAGSPNSRRQTQTEGTLAVHLAANLVQWLGNGVLQRK